MRHSEEVGIGKRRTVRGNKRVAVVRGLLAVNLLLIFESPAFAAAVICTAR
jgi:hypothetical protein